MVPTWREFLASGVGKGAVPLLLALTSALALLGGLWLLASRRRRLLRALLSGDGEPESGPGPAVSRDLAFMLGIGTLLVGAPGAVLAWTLRPYEGPPTLAIVLGALAAGGGIVAAVRASTAGTRGAPLEIAAEMGPIAAWERKHPRAGHLVVLVACVVGLAFLAVRRNHPPFVPDPWLDSQVPAADPSVVASLLWALLTGLTAVLFIEAGVKSRRIEGAGQAALVALGVLAGASASAAGYFLLLRIPPPLPRGPEYHGVILRTAGYAVLLVLAIVPWWRSLRRTSRAPSSGPPGSPPSP